MMEGASLKVRKRQRTAALQDLRRFVRVGPREASWSAAVLCRFSAFALALVSCAQEPVHRSANSSMPDPIIRSEFIFEKAPFPSCHASTIAETPDGLVAAWFGGTAERNPDVQIWSSRREPSGWTEPKVAGTGIQADGKRYPCWNPVLFQA